MHSFGGTDVHADAVQMCLKRSALALDGRGAAHAEIEGGNHPPGVSQHPMF